MTCIVHPSFQTLSSFIHLLPQRFKQGGTTINKGRNELKVFDVEGLTVNVKAFRRPNWLNRWIYTRWRPSKARRSYENSLRLSELGFTVPQPLGYVECFSGHLLDDSYFVSVQWPFTTDFRPFEKMNDEAIKPWISTLEAFGAYVGRLHEVGILHKDLSVGNVLMADDQPNVFCLVDLNRMRFGPVDASEGCANFARLRGNATFFKALARGYAAVRGLDPDACFQRMSRANEKSVRYFARKSRYKRWKARHGLNRFTQA